MDPFSNFDFQNGPDSVVLYDADVALDAVGYGELAPDEVFAGEGMPAPDSPLGSSLARDFADLDSDDNVLDFEVLDVPNRAAPSCTRCPSLARRRAQRSLSAASVKSDSRLRHPAATTTAAYRLEIAANASSSQGSFAPRELRALVQRSLVQ